jgi:hypothetical protein
LRKEKNTKWNKKVNSLLAFLQNFYPWEVIFLKDVARGIRKNDLDIYLCPECGEPLENVSASESHQNNVYELHLRAWHGKLHAESH